MNRHADFLLRLVDSLNVRYAWERSVRLCRGGPFTNRFLLTLPRKTLDRYPAELVPSFCRRLGMPPAMVEEARADLPSVQFVHFGFEENNASSLYKVYLEFDGGRAVPGSPFLLHLAFKWDVTDESRHFVTRYHWYRDLSADEILGRLGQIYRGSACAVPRDIASRVLELAAGRPGHRMTYLEVVEPANERRSFDLNVYDALFQVQDLLPLLARMSEHYSIPEPQFRALYERIKAYRFGHLAGGTHRDGEDFFNLYYGVQWREGRTVSGFGEQPSEAELPALAAANPLPSGQRTLRAGHVQGPEATMSTRERYERTTEQDQYFSYCLWPYLPVASTANKYRAVTLLFQSFEVAGLDRRAYELVDRIRAEIGLFQTVWGVKWVGGRLTWEFYFYDYQRRERDVSITRVLEAIRPLIRCGVRANESLGYFMFSLDINEDLLSATTDLDVVHMYVGNPGSRVSSGIAYALTNQGPALENFYFFFEAKRDLRQAAEKVYNSVHLDAARIDIDRILQPELRNCNTICIANKQKNDTAYFSGVDVDQLLFFLGRLDYPPKIVSFVAENRHMLDHLLYDVGFDYVGRGDELVMLKSGYYGVF